MRNRAWVLPFVVMSLLVSGCAGSKTLVATEEPPRASFAAETGGIEGLVTDPEYRPVAAAQLQIIGVKQIANSTADGRFAFSDLVPQDYLMIVKAAGFIDKQQPVSVPVGNVTNIRIVLEPVPPPIPYADPVYRFAGKFQAGVGIRANDRSANTSTGTASNSGKNDFVPRSDWQTILLEVVWTPNRAESDMMSLRVTRPDRCGATGTSVCLVDHVFAPASKSPLQWRLDRPQFEEMRKTRPNMTFSSFVGVPFQVYPAIDSQGTYDYGLFLEQSFIVYGTVGYNGPLPEGYSRAGAG